MKGITHYYGKDQLQYLLLSSGGNSASSVAMADDCIERYEMQGFSRIRMEHDEFARTAVAWFGHFSYGYVVIGADGLLKGVNALGPQMAPLIARAVSGGDESTESEDFRVVSQVQDKKGGRDQWDISNRLPKKMTATLVVTLSIPDGWHVYGTARANPTPTTLIVDYAGGLTLGKPVIPGGVGQPGGTMRHHGPVKITVPLEAAEGTPIGNYLVHGTLRFMACDAERCLPPMELPWKAKVEVF